MFSVSHSRSNRIPHVLNWIDQQKVYANPIFALLLVINVFVMPSYRASAALDEPIQPTATTPQQVQDAVDAVEVGVGPEDAFLENPVPIRNWGKDQKHVYEALFNLPYNIYDAVYIPDMDIAVVDELTEISGSTILGDSFTMRFSLIENYDYRQDVNLPASDIAELDAINADFLGIAGTISTQQNTICINGIIIQASRVDGERNRILLITGLADCGILESLEIDNNTISQEAIESAIGQGSDCEQGFFDAGNIRKQDLEDAIGNYKACLNIAIAGLVSAVVACAIGGGLAGMVSSATGPGAVVIGLIAGFGCGVTALAAYAGAVAACAIMYMNDRARANRHYQNTIDNLREIFGEENCPGDPV